MIALAGVVFLGRRVVQGWRCSELARWYDLACATDVEMGDASADLAVMWAALKRRGEREGVSATWLLRNDRHAQAQWALAKYHAKGPPDAQERARKAEYDRARAAQLREAYEAQRAAWSGCEPFVAFKHWRSSGQVARAATPGELLKRGEDWVKVRRARR